ncbi:hypothetical protein FACS1894137_17000 [Spirochaetia bacterium]|nr:hypothetical protein FACS1894137_17000 [Spirochaetia bacterium]
MESCCLDRYTPLKTALKEAGFIVEKVGKEGKKTVITVIRYGALGEDPGIVTITKGLSAFAGHINRKGVFK